MPRKINQFGMFTSLCLALFGIHASALGAAHTYAPAAVTEYHSVGWGDDDCDAAGANIAPPITLAVGDTISWTYVYGASATGYKVTSTDKADIEILELRSPNIVGGGIVTNLTVQFMSGPAANIPLSGVYNVGNITWCANQCGFRENDVLGNMKRLTAGGIFAITGFKVVATQIAGTVDVQSMTFRWEAGDIFPWP